MNWLDDVQYVGALKARFRIAVVLQQQLRARVLSELLNAANARAMHATPPVLLFYAAHGYAPDSPHAIGELIGAGRIDEALRLAAGVP